jgi:hypothetical protein
MDGPGATLPTTSDSDILREKVCLVTQRVRAGRATFLIKVKSRRGEPINERADTLAEEGREISDDEKRWDDLTDQMMLEVRKGNTTVRSVWTNSVRNAFRKQAGWAKLQEARQAAKHWTERVWYRHNQHWLQVSREGTEASKGGSFKDEQEWGRKCFDHLDQRRMGRPVTRTWSTDFLEGLSREEIGKWLKNKSIPWQRRRRLLQVVTGTFPCGQQMLKYGYKRTAECTLCIPWKEANGGSPVPEEQYQERFWRRRLDGIGLDTVNKEFLAIEFKRTQDARSNYVERATVVAQEQYTSLLTGLQAVGQVKGWKVQQIVFVGGTGESVPQETGEQSSLSSDWSDAPCLNRRRHGSLYSIVEYE